MSKSLVEVCYHILADTAVVDRLVQRHGSELIAAVELQQARGRPPQAYLLTEGYWLSAHSRSSALAQGRTMKPSAEFLIMGVPDGCELADFIRSHLANDKSCIGPIFND